MIPGEKEIIIWNGIEQILIGHKIWSIKYLTVSWLVELESSFCRQAIFLIVSMNLQFLMIVVVKVFHLFGMTQLIWTKVKKFINSLLQIQIMIFTLWSKPTLWEWYRINVTMIKLIHFLVFRFKLVKKVNKYQREAISTIIGNLCLLEMGHIKRAIIS